MIKISCMYIVKWSYCVGGKMQQFPFKKNMISRLKILVKRRRFRCIRTTCTLNTFPSASFSTNWWMWRKKKTNPRHCVQDPLRWVRPCFYIGKNENFERHLKQYMKDFGNKKVISNALAKHAELAECDICWEEASVVAKGRNGLSSQYLESLAI